MTRLDGVTMVVRADVEQQLRDAAELESPVLVLPAPSATAPLATRVVVPLEGEAEASDALASHLYDLVGADTELIVLHVFTADAAPPVLDRPIRDLELWATEFLSRYFPHATRMECRSVDGGSIGSTIAAFTAETGADLVAIGWSGDPSPDHAAIVRDVLARTDVPVLLLPSPAAVTRPRGR